MVKCLKWQILFQIKEKKQKFKTLFLKNRHNEFLERNVFFKDRFSIQSMKIARWHLFGSNSYGTVGDSRSEKSPNRSSILELSHVAEPLFQLKFYYNNICNSCKTLQLDLFSNKQLLKIYLLLKNFTVFLEKITVMITFSACTALLAYWTLLTQIYYNQYCFLTASILCHFYS